MKSQKTMLALARVKAFNTDEIETDYLGQTFIGYRLTYSQLLKFYHSEGFTEAAMKRHIQIWQDLGAIRILNKLIFFLPEPAEVQYTILRAEAARRPDAILIAEAVA